MTNYKQMLHTLLAVALAAVGVRVVQNGGDWLSALDGLAVAAGTGLIKILNPYDADGGVQAKSVS